MRRPSRSIQALEPAPPAVKLLRLLAALLTVLLGALALRARAHVFDMPLTEDGYYALTVARNLARGHGITIDGATWTSGFQPLFTLLQAVAFALADVIAWVVSRVLPVSADSIAIRLVLLLHGAFHGATALLVGLIARDAWPADAADRRLRFWLAGVLWLAAPLVFNHGYNGLETGALLCLVAACWRWVQCGHDETPRGRAVLGVLLGLTVLARVDAVFLVAALCLRELHRARRLGFRPAFARACVIGLVAVAVSSPWWAYNWVLSGSPMPSSGTAQQVWAFDPSRIGEAIWALGIVLVPWVFAGAHESLATSVLRGLALVGYAAVAGAILRLRLAAPASANDNDPNLGKRTFAFALSLAGAGAALVLYYTASFSASWFYYRYFAPLALLAGVFVPVAVVLAARRWGFSGTLAPLAWLAASPVLVVTVLAQWGGGFSGQAVFFDQVALVRAHVPEGARVAAGQSGTLGFFRERVVNLDGKVNRAALAWQGDMRAYLRREGIVWFCDWPDYTDRYLGADPAAHGWREVASRGDFRLYRYEGPL